jgi:hypothetical protein
MTPATPVARGHALATEEEQTLVDFLAVGRVVVYLGRGAPGHDVA